MMHFGNGDKLNSTEAQKDSDVLWH